MFTYVFCEYTAGVWLPDENLKTVKDVAVFSQFIWIIYYMMAFLSACLISCTCLHVCIVVCLSERARMLVCMCLSTPSNYQMAMFPNHACITYVVNPPGWKNPIQTQTHTRTCDNLFICSLSTQKFSHMQTPRWTQTHTPHDNVLTLRWHTHVLHSPLNKDDANRHPRVGIQ